MSGAIPPFPKYIFMAWCVIKYRDNFTFYLWVGKHEGKGHSEDLGVDGSVILEWVLGR
jgi:hypothetical protein